MWRWSSWMPRRGFQIRTPGSSDMRLKRGEGIILVVNKWDLIKGDDRKRRLLDNAIERQLKFISFAPRINVSALTGERVMKLFGKIDMVYDQFSKRISTGALNRAIQKVIEKHPPPWLGRGRLKFFYATQGRTRPPTFMVFVNRPDKLHFSYERFLVNQLREQFGLDLFAYQVEVQER